MSEGTEERPPQSGDRATGVDEDVRSTGDEGKRAASASPPIGDDANRGKTQRPPEPGDVGVPPDEEMNEEDR